MQDSLSAEALEVNFDLSSLLFHRKSGFSIKSHIIQLNDAIKLDFKATGEFNLRRNSFTIAPEISSIEIKDNEAGIKSIKITGDITGQDDNYIFNNLRIDFGNGRIKLSSDIQLGQHYTHTSLDELTTSVDIRNIPLSFYKILLSKENSVYKFLEKSILSGNIDSANFTLALPKDLLEIIYGGNLALIRENFTEQNLSGDLQLSKVEYKYDEYLPTIHAPILPIKLNGSTVRLLLKNTVVADNIVSEGRVKFDFLADEFTVVVDARSHGSAEGLTHFISKSALESMKNSSIDLSKLKGRADSDIKIIIPMQDGKDNIYDISSTISNTSLSILHDRVKIENYIIKGKFNGASVTIDGRGHINNYNSNIKLSVNLLDDAPYAYMLDGKVYISKDPNADDGVIFRDGESLLKISMLSDKNGNNLTLSSNLINSDFIIPALAIEKKIGKKAQFTMKGKMQEGMQQIFDVQLEGEDSLKIRGSIMTNDVKNSISFKEVQYLNNDFSLTLVTTKKSIVADVNGKMLDLSKANFEKFVNSGTSSASNIKLNFKLNTIKMKNGISLTDSMIIMDCYNGKCPVARLNTKIDHKDYLHLEYLDSSKPQWKLESNQAGKIFAALGITDKLKSGKIKLVIDAPITSKIADYQSLGMVEIFDISSSQNKFIAKMVSFISVPGLLGALTNRDITFEKIYSDIMYQNNVITLSKTSAEGPYFNFFIKGYIDLTKHKVDVKGQVVPSLYGLNKLVGSAPVIKYLFGSRGGVVFTPFFYSDNF